MDRYDEGRRNEERSNHAILALGLCIPFAATGAPVLALLPALALAHGAVQWVGRKSCLDEGGIRIDRLGGFRHDYLPYCTIARVRIDDTSVIAESASNEVLLAWNLPDLARRSRLYADLTVRVAAEERSAPSAFERNERSFEDWLGALNAISRGDPYRAVELDLTTARAILESSNTPTDARAAAAYLLLQSGNPSHIEYVHARLVPESPPLVWALASVASPGLLERAKPAARYLDGADRSAWKNHFR